MTRALLALSTFAAALAGCSDLSPVDEARVPGVATFAPSTGDLPVPSDFLYSGSVDATLNPPVDDPADFSDPLVAISALDGWSTSAQFRIPFTRPLDGTSLIAGQTVRLFQVTTEVTPTAPVGGAVQSVVGEVLDFEVGLASEDATNSTVVVRPTIPFQAATSYMLVITNGLLDSEGFAMAADREFVLGGANDPWPDGSLLADLQSRLVPMLDAVETQGIARTDVVLANVFTTQGVTDVTGVLLGLSAGLEQAIIDNICLNIPNPCDSTVPDPRSMPVLGAGFANIGDTSTFVPGSPGVADVILGSVTLPYYLTSSVNGTAAGTTNDAAPLTEFWRARYAFVPGDTERNMTRFNPLPAITGQEAVPMLICIPNVGTEPDDGWPVVLFQHGITGDRTNLLAIADAFAAQGLASVAIDLPLHGVTDSASPFFTSHTDGAIRERHFGLDLVDNMTGAPGPDTMVDGSGTHFINLNSLLVTRDNLRQGHADILNLLTILPTIDTDSMGGPDFDATRIHFVGHSLGAIVGIGALSASSGALTKTFAMPGGGLPKMLVDSPAFRDQIIDGLSAAGVEEGTADFELFLFAAQTATDAGDPVNYAQAYSAPDQRVHMIEIVGDAAAMPPVLPDVVIPNTIADAPLSGTEPLIALMALPSVSVTLTDAAGARGAVRFLEGDHSSILLPTASLDAFTEIQTQTARFAASNGEQILIGDELIVQ